MAFSIDPKEFAGWFDPKNAPAYHAKGGLSATCKALKTDATAGLSDAEAASEERRAFYGANVLPETESRSLLELIWTGLQDNTLVMLSVAAVISLILGIREDPRTGWLEGTAILVAVFLVVLVAASNDYQKEKQFRKLNAKKDAKDVKVVRGGKKHQVPVSELVVGDLIEVCTGDIISVDGVFVSGFNLVTDESGATGESEPVKKEAQGDPFFLSGTQVMEGVGMMLCTAVGVNSFNGKAMMSLRVEPEETPLQKKLHALAEDIANFGIYAAGATFGLLTLKHVVLMYMHGEAIDASLFSAIVKYVITGITMLVVAVPEGLPLAVTLSLAYSMMKMLADNNLVRHLDACETMGGATIICSDKTGTLTQNKMTVVTGLISGKVFTKVEKSLSAGWTPAYVASLIDGIAVNSTASIMTQADGRTQLVGSSTEVALLEFMQTLGYDFNDIRARLAPQVVSVYPFSSKNKLMATAIKAGGKTTLYVKGASEVVLARCDRITDAQGNVTPLTPAQRKSITEDIERFATQALRTIVLASGELQSKYDEKDCPEVGLVFAGLVGIQDPLREEVPAAVRQCAEAGIRVRMVTGDNLITARNIAKNCGIYQEGGLCMEGPEFRKLEGAKLEEAARNLCVLARSSPMDKQILVRTLKEMGEVVAATGDGTNDGPALKLAHVGFSMGITGTEVAKEASDIVLMDDNFSSIVKAVLWGRNVFDSIRKFLQFQLTVNIAAVVLAFVGSLTSDHGESPLKPVQLLWVNLIMDTMAALALATEAPTASLLKRKPYGATDSLITPMMWRMILGQGVYQMLVNFFMLYRGHLYLGVERESIKHMTIFFNMFVMCQLFNEINSRKIHGEKNVFKGILNNSIFVGVMAFTLIMQYIIVQFGGSFLHTTPLTLNEWLICIGIGAVSLPWGFLLRCIPYTEPVSTNAAGKAEEIKKEAVIIEERKKAALNRFKGAALKVKSEVVAIQGMTPKAHNPLGPANVHRKGSIVNTLKGTNRK